METVPFWLSSPGDQVPYHPVVSLVMEDGRQRTVLGHRHRQGWWLVPLITTEFGSPPGCGIASVEATLAGSVVSPPSPIREHTFRSPPKIHHAESVSLLRLLRFLASTELDGGTSDRAPLQWWAYD